MVNRSLAHLAAVLEKHINIIKYILHCITFIQWILAGFLLGMAIALRLDTGLSEWIWTLEIGQYYIGVYVLIFSSVIAFLLPALSCFSIYQEISQLLMLNVAGHFCCFLLLMLGSGILMENSTPHTDIESSIRYSIKNMIISSYRDRNWQRLNTIQEEIGCCAAEEPDDYLLLFKPIPSECRDTVTGFEHFYSCTDQLVWFLHEQSSWLTWLAYIVGFLEILIATLSYLLVEALRKEERITYRK